MVGISEEHPPLVTTGTSPHLVVIGGIVIVIWSLITAVTGIMAKVDPMCATVEFLLPAHYGMVAIAAV